MIRPSISSDIDTILQLIDQGRQKMIAEGNTHQWVNGYPSREMIENDIACGRSYMVESDADGEPLATFVLMSGPDPTYGRIDDGEWLNDEPYYVIHRIASSAKVRGVMRQVVAYALTKTANIRIDTHADNHTMQAVLGRLGFRRCGIIYLTNGAERVAFQLTSATT
jgi:RimJ/RimL family protein N-acetyltransferase